MFYYYTICIIFLPVLTALGLLLVYFSGASNKETIAAKLSIASFFILLGVSLYELVVAFLIPQQTVIFDHWINLKEYFFDVSFEPAIFSLVFVCLCSLLFFVISCFSRTYLHGEVGSFRFYVLINLFSCGVNLIALTNSIDVLFAGWELVGLTSFLLIGYFNMREQPVENALKVFRIYKVCDIALLTAAIWLHVFYHQTLLTSVPAHPTDTLTTISALIVFASLGKSAQFPFCNWLTLAIEGPTPSSTIFYGSISTHLGCLLLLKSFPLLEQSAVILTSIIIIGMLSSLYGTIVGRVQPDIKSSIAYSTVAQIGLIYMEIGLGFLTLASVHLCLHMCYRTYQFLWSPSIIDDHTHTEMEAGRGDLFPGKHYSFLSEKFRARLYILALNKFHLNSWCFKLLKVIEIILDKFLRQEEAWANKGTRKAKKL